MKRPPFIKNKKIYLGGKRQRGGSFLLGASILVPLISKLLTGKGRRKKKKRWRDVGII